MAGATKREKDGDLDILVEMIGELLPDRSPFHGRRRVFIPAHPGGGPEIDAFTRATSALSDRRADAYVDLPVILKLLEVAATLARKERDLTPRIVEHVERRWRHLAPSLAAHAAEVYGGHALFDHFPRLRSEPLFIAALARVLSSRDYTHLSWLVELLAELAPSTQWEARTLIAAVATRGNPDLSTCLFRAIARGMGWTPWVSLLAILKARPDYAEPQATFAVARRDAGISDLVAHARRDMARAIERQIRVRAVAAMLLEVIGPHGGRGTDRLLGRPGETRAAYVESLRDCIGNRAPLRQAAIETLLWWGDGEATDLAHFAATALARSADRDMLSGLGDHPVRVVHYAARAVRAAKFGESLDASGPPTAGSLVQRLAALEGGVADNEEAARTWLGDRNVERLIEHTIARVEAGAARDYDDHGDEGEDRLLASLFRELALRFDDLDQALEGLARAASAPHRASVRMHYRNVDRPEEGAEGIKQARKFAADLCLIVDPWIDGISLGRRVTLVQAKRVYRNKRAARQPAWNASFEIDREQRLALQAQTHSSVYLFLGPPGGGRGVPVIPTQLVADLAEHRGTGTRLRREVVTVASRSLADWLTYDALALRVGDPCADLVEKAEGQPGGLPRRLLDLPTLEVQVALAPRSERRR
ncbi:MAG TPA: hypothetical protein VMG08_04965 [Allosphingosinicella sp.]|nr:hypothetical protein [Allosphingosinicella sp.]